MQYQTTGARLVPMYSRFANAMTGELASNSRVIDGQVHLPLVSKCAFQTVIFGRYAPTGSGSAHGSVGGSGPDSAAFLGTTLSVLVDEGGHLPSGLAIGSSAAGRNPREGIRASGPTLSETFRVFIEDRVAALLVEPEL